MWVLTIRSPWSEPREYLLQPGKTTLGRNPNNDIVISDDSASRAHAEVEYDTGANTVTVRDLGSTNGTFINRELLVDAHVLRPDDQVRIGQHVLTLTDRRQVDGATRLGELPSTQPLTRDLVLQSVDQHALVLYEVANRLNAILDLDVSLREVSEVARVGLGADRCEVIPISRFDKLADLGFPTSIARQAIDERSAVFIPDMSAEMGQQPGRSALLLRIRSVLCVPGLAGDEVVALTYAYRAGSTGRPFDQKDLQLAVAISHQAALTIQRADLYKRMRQLEQLAITDELTGLHNRRHFIQIAEQEFLRARRYQRPLAALLIDVDRFKRINEVYGPGVGDMVLRSVSTACRENLRESHLLCRYGPDEFAVLLLECNLVIAQQVAERLRQRVAAVSVEVGGSANPLAISASAGCAALSEYSPDLTTLMHQAETALYAAKKEAGL